MKKPFKIGCLVIFVIGLLLMIGQAIWVSKEGPTQAFTFLNSGGATRSVTFERIDKDGKPQDVYTINNVMKTDQFIHNQIPVGDYKVSVWNADKSLFKSFDFKVALQDPEKTNHYPFRLDVAMDKMYTIVNMNALYEGNSLAEFMSKAAGTKQSGIKFEKFYDGSVPFFVPEEYAARTFVDVDGKIPSKVKYGEMVYGLFAFPKSLPKDQVEAEIVSQIAEKIK
ncbi:hypothetical protein [Flavobacterium cerinum]|uniref:Uncharacterized protein n=1 Tax=Flavobacterium cerinum TaxID=2502784 RepID=A0A444GL86_9FLAO|nr:hypothetical protein [Flavobacterium cerinum]RWW91779.1 hypothetical protein EPI11_18015 [Flavobacterium cerinum]